MFGRVTPRQKRAMVLAIQGQGHVVAMTGDGVNDVLALKDADMGIAMGSGSEASRSVAQLVLMDDRFASLPGVLAEGRRVMNSVERAANLFVYGTVYSVLMSTVVSIVGRRLPLPAAPPDAGALAQRGHPGAVPGAGPRPPPGPHGLPAAGWCASRSRPGSSPGRRRWRSTSPPARSTASTLTESRSSATITLLGVGLGLLVRLTATLPPWRWALVGSDGPGHRGRQWPCRRSPRSST